MKIKHESRKKTQHGWKYKENKWQLKETLLSKESVAFLAVSHVFVVEFELQRNCDWSFKECVVDEVSLGMRGQLTTYKSKSLFLLTWFILFLEKVNCASKPVVIFIQQLFYSKRCRRGRDKQSREIRSDSRITVYLNNEQKERTKRKRGMSKTLYFLASTLLYLYWLPDFFSSPWLSFRETVKKTDSF